MSTTAEKIAVMQAFVEGQSIEIRRSSDGEWYIQTSPNWNWVNYDYRAKPKPREWWVWQGRDGGMGTAYTKKEMEIMTGSTFVHVREVLP